MVTPQGLQEEHEQKVCEAVIRVMAMRKGEEWSILDRPEISERRKKAVELIFRLGTSEYALEHTRIESFPEQLVDNHQLTELLRPLQMRLDGTMPLPGSYWLNVHVRAVRGAKKGSEIRDALEGWIRQNAPGLALGSPATAPRHFVRERPPGVPFEVSLYRWPGLDGRLFIGQFSPEKLEDLRRQRIRSALAAKCPKLLAAKDRSRISVLVFESSDIALANPVLIGKALIEELSLRQGDVPDEVYLVGTELKEAWVAWVLKEGSHEFPHVPREGPYYVLPQTMKVSFRSPNPS